MLESIVKKLAEKTLDLKIKHGTLGKLIELVYEIASSAVFQSIVHVIATLVLGIGYSKSYSTIITNEAESVTEIIEKNVLNKSFIIWFIIIYGAFLILFLLCNTYRKVQNTDIGIRENTLDTLRTQTLVLADHELDLNQRTSTATLEEIVQIYNQDRSFFDICFSYCKAILGTLNSVSEVRNPGLKVEIFVRNRESDDKDTYQMIAYAPRTGTPPEAYHPEKDPFDLAVFRNKLGPDIDYGDEQFQELTRKNKIPCHSWPFLSKRNEIITLFGKEQIEGYYINYHSKKPTKLHIAIPAVVIGDLTLVVIQITSKKEFVFGNKDEIENNIQNLYEQIISAYCNNLTLYQAITCNRDIISRAIENNKSDLTQATKKGGSHD